MADVQTEDEREIERWRMYRQRMRETERWRMYRQRMRERQRDG